MYYIVVAIVRVAMHLWFDLKFEGRENIPKGRTFVYASNHRSNADPVLVTLAGKGRFSFMAKIELFRNRFFAWLIRSLGAFPVERGKGDTAAIDKAIDNVKNGVNLLIFPEGTRSRDGRVGKGKTGVALIASKAHADVVPVGINFEGKLHFRSRIVVRIGKPIPASTFEIGEELSDRELLRALKRDVMPPIMDGIRALVDEPPALPMNETPKEDD
ncbi:MAG: 1-acyl-sn-glycerol-3-phosphate acyltransferase [Oscillospiraceae bacterium]|nr:1-acyl-sn-glycerol-3-phosphate acyltransferase [Oscillospiraceae bacterium]